MKKKEPKIEVNLTQYTLRNGMCETGCCFRIDVLCENGQEMNANILSNLLEQFSKQVAQGKIKIQKNTKNKHQSLLN